MSQAFDVCIAGGGPAGSALAIILARIGVSVTLVIGDNCQERADVEIYGPRLLETFSNIGLPFSDNMGVPIQYFLSSWGTPNLESRDFKMMTARAGRAVPRQVLKAWMNAQAERMGVNVIKGDVISGTYSTKKHWQISVATLKGQKTLTAHLAVEATGNRSRSVFFPNVKRQYVDNLMCLTVETDQHPSLYDSAIVESCRAGWWFAAPVNSDRQNVSLFTHAKLILGSSKAKFWKLALNETIHIKPLLEKPLDSPINVWNARTSIRSTLYKSKCIAIGDAGWSLDPLSGNGVKRAVDDAIAASSAISDFLANNSDALHKFAIERIHQFDHALSEKQHYYDLETRWQSEPFWSRVMKS